MAFAWIRRAWIVTLALIVGASVVGFAALPAGATPFGWKRCSKLAGKAAAEQAGIKAAVNADPVLRKTFDSQQRPVITRYVNDSLCGDYDGDGDRDRAVLYSGFTGGSPRPWVVLRRSKSGWAIAYRRMHDLTFSLTPDGKNLRSLEPVYSRNDATCCPSGVKIGTLRWTGRSFKRTFKVRPFP